MNRDRLINAALAAVASLGLINPGPADARSASESVRNCTRTLTRAMCAGLIIKAGYCVQQQGGSSEQAVLLGTTRVLEDAGVSLHTLSSWEREEATRVAARTPC
jgi:hypothetical protein